VVMRWLRACLFYVCVQVVQGAMRSVSAGSAPEKRMGDDVHFNKRKGVVNTMGGAKDYSRLAAAAAGTVEPLRKSDALRSGGVHTLSSSTASTPSRARGGSAGESRASAGGIHTFAQLEHDSKPGLRKGDGLGGGASASVTSAPTKTGHLGGFTAIAPTKKPPKASSVAAGGPSRAEVLAAPRPAPSAGPKSLGGGPSPSSAVLSDREKRLAYFDKQTK
jgi:hypothetical protein